MLDKKCNYALHSQQSLRSKPERLRRSHGKGYHQSFEGGDWHTSSCHKCNPCSPWYKKPVEKK